MLIYGQHRFIFLKTRKTASTSAEIALFASLQDPEGIIKPISSGHEKTRKRLELPRPCNHLAQAPKHRSKDLSKLLGKLKEKKRFCSHMPADRVRNLASEAIWRGCEIISVERQSNYLRPYNPVEPTQQTTKKPSRQDYLYWSKVHNKDSKNCKDAHAAGRQICSTTA